MGRQIEMTLKVGPERSLKGEGNIRGCGEPFQQFFYQREEGLLKFISEDGYSQ